MLELSCHGITEKHPATARFAGRQKGNFMKYIEKLRWLNTLRETGEWANRIAAEITYLDAISKHRENRYDRQIEAGLDYLLAGFEKNGCITRQAVLDTENLLSDLAPVAKSLKELFVGHAHIDMNWMWSYNETACIVVDTFRTMLTLMKQYPGFTFGQSQASTYELAEKFCPELLPEIREMIKKGNWEVTASEWVEPDKNMIDGESMTRHILQTRKYLSKLLDIPKESFDFDFVPDTFGHNINVPEALANAGVKYLYHWRGSEENPRVYYYVSPSGKKVLTYREFVCYLGDVKTEKFEFVPEFCAETGLDTYLCVYGVGDHGGGPTMMDIERIMEYRSWPLTPTIEFGTFRQFFKIIENSGLKIPEVHKELNYLFTGCYSSQSRIKMANRLGEARLNDVEKLDAADSLLSGTPRNPSKLDRAWRNVLFNHFHDILPGSGVLETREHALGVFQETMAYTNVLAGTAMRHISDAIDTSSIPFVDDGMTRSVGAGVGFNQQPMLRWSFPVCDRGNGPVRALNIFNTTQYDREEFTLVYVWNYDYDTSDIAFFDPDGNRLEFVSQEPPTYGGIFWGHMYSAFLVKVKVPALGYTTIILKPDPKDVDHLDRYAEEYKRGNEFVATDVPLVVENEYLRASFDTKTAMITELYDKETDEMLISEPSGYLNLIYENSNCGMTAWKSGFIAREINLHSDTASQVRIKTWTPSGPKASIGFEIKYGSSSFNVKASLLPGSRCIEYDIHAIWKIDGTDNQDLIPQLRFDLPVSYGRTGRFKYDIPYGIITHEDMAHEVPALSYIGIESTGKHSLGIVTDTKYAYRCHGGRGSVVLLRSSFDPDICPERGNCFAKVGIMAAPLDDMKKISTLFNHPMPYTSATRHGGKLPLTDSVLKVDGNVIVSAVKVSENAKGTTVRLYDVTGSDQKATITIKDAQRAALTTSNEDEIKELAVTDGAVSVTVPANDFVTVVIE